MGTTYSLDAMITALLAAGFEVAFTRDDSGVYAHVDDRSDPTSDKGCTAGGKTLAEALWAASPEGFAICACEHANGSHWEVSEPEGPRVGCAVLGCRCRMYGEYEPQPASLADLPDVLAAVWRDGARAGALGDEARAGEEAEHPWMRIGLLTVLGRTRNPLQCECAHPRASHWEHAEPDGPRTGCGILGCGCGAYAPE